MKRTIQVTRSSMPNLEEYLAKVLKFERFNYLVLTIRQLWSLKNKNQKNKNGEFK